MSIEREADEAGVDIGVDEADNISFLVGSG